MTEQTIDQLVQERIKAIFSEIAEMVGNGQVPHVTEDEAAGIPLGLFRAEQALLGAWRCVVEPTHVDDGMLYNLSQEFHTADPYQLLTELHEARSMLLSDNADLRADRDAARADVARLTEALEFTGEAAGRNAAERDATRAELVGWHAAADGFAMLGARLLLANLRLKRAALRLYHERNDARAWAATWKASAKNARETIQALVIIVDEAVADVNALVEPGGYRDADVSALVRAAGELAYVVDPHNNMSDIPIWDALSLVRAALRPFRRVRVPVVGELSSKTTPEEWEWFRDYSIPYSEGVMTAEAPAGMASDE